MAAHPPAGHTVSFRHVLPSSYYFLGGSDSSRPSGGEVAPRGGRGLCFSDMGDVEYVSVLRIFSEGLSLWGPWPVCKEDCSFRC